MKRRLKAVPDNLPGLIGALGRHLVTLIQPWTQSGQWGVWHKKHPDQGIVPHSSIDTEANWYKSGYHGWWYGWKLHCACAVTSFWLPLAAELTVANTYDANLAPTLIRELPVEVPYVLGDHFLLTPKPGPYPHTDQGVPVRRVLHKLRSLAIQPFNGLFKNIFECNGQVPLKGLHRVRWVVLGAVLVYQLVFLYQSQAGLPLGKGIKALLRAA